MGDMLRPAAIAATFPGLAQSVGGQPLAYLDNAATTHMPAAVMEAMAAYEAGSRANIHRGVHTLSQRSTDAFELARSTLKRFMGAGHEHELVFTSGATEALNLVAHGLSDSAHGPAFLQPGDEIVVSALEHHANLVPWQLAARRSAASLLVLRPDSAGRLHEDDLARLLGPRTRVFAVTACSNATGERPPYEALLALAREAGALTVLDAAQAVGHAPPQVQALACDFLAFSGHKMHGPMGTGVLLGRRDALERLAPLRLGGDMVEWVTESEASYAELPARLEGGTPNVAGAVGLAAAAQFLTDSGVAAIHEHVRSLRRHAAAGLSALAGVRVLSPEADQSAIVSFVAAGAHPHDLGTLLDGLGVAVRTGHHCAQPYLACLGVGPTTRASFAIYNTHEEVERLVAGVDQALKVLR